MSFRKLPGRERTATALRRNRVDRNLGKAHVMAITKETPP
jgi:hypothetical protein